MVILYFLIIWMDILYVSSIIVEKHSGIDVIFDTEHKIKSADVYVYRKIYFFVVLENGRSSLKALNNSQSEPKRLVNVLELPVQSAQSVAVDWVNGNLYWADKGNRFFEVVDINHGMTFPIPKRRRRILFSHEMADIDSLVVDPWEQYLFWLHIGADMVIERARLNGQDRTVIYRSIHYKSSSLTIDQHTKMLFWLGIEAEIHRVDYQGRTGCRMHLEGDWKNWKPSFLVFSESRLIFMANGAMWTTVFNCGSGQASHIDAIRSPSAIITVGYQLARPGTASNQCRKASCNSICLPTNESHYQCTCSTGINRYPSNNGTCPDSPLKSLIIASPPRIYQLSLDDNKMHMDPIFEEAGIPFQIAFDSATSSIFYVDYNSSSIHVLPIFGYKPSKPLIFDSPIGFQVPSTFALDSRSRNIYWMNGQTSEVWVARISSSSNRLRNAGLLLSWRPDSLSTNRHNAPQSGKQTHLPGDLAIDSVNRYLFVSAIRDGKASIERHWLDGTNKFVILQSPRIINPRGLTFDCQKQELFFVDITKDVLISVGYSGNNFRIIAKRFSDFFGLTFLDGYIFWTDLETLMVNQIRSDGMSRSTVVSTHNLRATTMPIVAVSNYDNSSIASPCATRSTNTCDQLCFAAHGASDTYSCGCSNRDKVLLNMAPCTRKGFILLMFNSSYIKLQHISSARDRTGDSVFELSSESTVSSVQIDHYRNYIYWIDRTNNCIVKSVIGSQSNLKSKLLCLSSDTITSISIDSIRNNLYVSIKSLIWSRIEIIRLPFQNSDLMWRKVIVSSAKDSVFIGTIVTHSMTNHLFWIASDSEHRLSIYQAELNGTMPQFLWSGIFDVDQLTIDDTGMYLYLKSSRSGGVIRYDINNREAHVFTFPGNIVIDPSVHLYATYHDLYLSQKSSLYKVDIRSSQSPITRDSIKLFVNGSVPQSLNGFAIFPQNISSKVALIKSDMILGLVVMCPNDVADTFAVCTQFCLPSHLSHCSCGSPYSLKSDGYTCAESNNHLLVVTSIGEVIGLEMKSRQDRHNEVDTTTEWIEIPEHQPLLGQRFIDAIYWASKNIILLLDNEGQIIGKHRSWPYHRTKAYKHLSILKDYNDAQKMSSTYEKAYRHFLAKDQTYRDEYESSRFSIAMDPVSDTLIWSDWVNGVIVTERLNNNQDSVDYLGIVVDFRHSSRRPLKIAVAPISSSLVWISADLSITGSNDSSIWRQFWIELSDMDGSRRTVLVNDPGLPSCLTVDVHTGRIYWIDKRTNVLMYLHVHWDNYQIKAGHVLGRGLKVTVNYVLMTGIGASSAAMTVLKGHLVWTDWVKQIVASAAIDGSDVNLHNNNNRMASEKIQVFEFPYVKHKLKTIVTLLARLSTEDLRGSSIGSLLLNHPCSHELTDVNGLLCSHLCLSTIPISLAEEYSILLTAKQLGGKFRCACPYDMAVKQPHTQGICLKTKFFRCEKNEFLCRAGRIFVNSDKLMRDNCMSSSKQCDGLEDCLDGSDEIGCNHCNTTHSYSCSASAMCMDIKKRCDGIVDCDSDEKCCDSQKFECLTGSGVSRCVSATDRCNGVRDCVDGSDESGCHLSDGTKKGSANGDITIIKNIRDNYLVAIVAGCVAVLACSVAIVYICVSRRNRQKTVHESCMFRADNVNIMLMSNSSRTPRRSRPHKSDNSMYHAQSCDIIDIYKSQHDSEHLSHSLTSLSDIYQRIRDPHPDRYAALKVPLFTIQDDVLFNLNRFRRVQDPYTSSDSNEKLGNPPPSEATANSEESVSLLPELAVTEEHVSRSSDMITPCESELEEIYFHRYRCSGNQSPSFHNYPSRLLQMLLTSNHSNYLHDSHSSRPVSRHKLDQHRRKKLYKHQKRRKVWKTNLSLSPQQKLYCSHESLTAQTVSPPPPSPITVLSDPSHC